MELYNECFDGINALLSEYPTRQLDFSNGSWSDDGKSQLILQRDTAFELGGGDLPAVSTIALTDSEDLVNRDEVILCGDDLDSIHSDVPFARITFLRVSADALGSGNALYQSIRKIEYTRYHLHPHGYMMRISPFSHRESARISKKALADGLNFSKAGKLFVDAYHRDERVLAVKIIFITRPDFPFDRLKKYSDRSENITKALDHLMNNIKMDCNACNLRTVCEEVEKLCVESEKK